MLQQRDNDLYRRGVGDRSICLSANVMYVMQLSDKRSGQAAADRKVKFKASQVKKNPIDGWPTRWVDDSNSGVIAGRKTKQTV